MQNIRINNYSVLFKLFSIKDLAQFVKEIQLKDNHNMVLNEQLALDLYKESSQEKMSQMSKKILYVILKLKDLPRLNEILRFISCEISNRIDNYKEINDETNCGIISYKDYKKTNLSIAEYMEQLRCFILKRIKGDI